MTADKPLEFWEYELLPDGSHEKNMSYFRRMGTLDRIEICHRCGGENVNWAAPSPLWNLVMRSNDIDGDPLYSDLVCLRCFVVLAEEAGVTGQWLLCMDKEPEGLIKTTPSGRVWNPETWMWEDDS